MDNLVLHLSKGEHLVTVGGPKPSLEEFQKRVGEMGYVFIKFTQTHGGTDLGVRIDEETTDLSQANFSQGIGIVHLEGTLVLNYVRVRCVANVNISTLDGTGHLVILEA